MMIQSGYMPTVLQQLCNLPFPYFSNPALSAVLFPTLLACCSDNQQNRAILEQEVSYQVGLICLSASLHLSNSTDFVPENLLTFVSVLACCICAFIPPSCVLPGNVARHFPESSSSQYWYFSLWVCCSNSGFNTVS
jgi:hypothetical protein